MIYLNRTMKEPSMDACIHKDRYEKMPGEAGSAFWKRTIGERGSIQKDRCGVIWMASSRKIARPILYRQEDPGKENVNASSKKGADKSASWTVYIVECRDGTFYTGITTDPARRLAEHNNGRASRYTRVRRPVRIIYEESCISRSEASMREAAVKALSRKEKENLIQVRRTDIPFSPID